MSRRINSSISGSSIISAILISRVLQLSGLFLLSTILYKLKQKSKKKLFELDQKLKWNFYSLKKMLLSQGQKLKEYFSSLTKKLFWVVIKITIVLHIHCVGYLFYHHSRTKMFSWFHKVFTLNSIHRLP